MNDVVSLGDRAPREDHFLGTKLDAMDVRFEEIVTEARKKLPGELRIPGRRCRPPSRV